jgi:hypothetical protein
MKSALIRSGAAAIVATFAFAACGGSNGMVPSSAGMASNTALHVAPAATNPCPIPVGWKFGGSCDPVALKATGAQGKLAPYKGFTLTSKLSSNNAAKGTFLVFQDATGAGDIKGKVSGKSFPKLKGTILYLAALNTGAAFTFNASPGIKITSTSAIKGTACALNELTTKGWIAPGITGIVKGKTVTFTALTIPGGEAVPAGPFYLAFTCSK